MSDDTRRQTIDISKLDFAVTSFLEEEGNGSFVDEPPILTGPSTTAVSQDELEYGPNANEQVNMPPAPPAEEETEADEQQPVTIDPQEIDDGGSAPWQMTSNVKAQKEAEREQLRVEAEAKTAADAVAAAEQQQRYSSAQADAMQEVDLISTAYSSANTSDSGEAATALLNTSTDASSSTSSSSDDTALLKDAYLQRDDLTMEEYDRVRAPSIMEQTGERLDVEVTKPEKKRSGLSSHMTYLVTTKTTLSLFKAKEFEVRRRYSDFLWLQEALKANYLGVLIPPMPEKHNPLTQDGFASDFVERRRRQLETFLRRVVHHPDLYKSYQVKIFLEGETSEMQAIRKKPSSSDHKKARRAAAAPMSTYKQFKTETIKEDPGVQERLSTANVYMDGLFAKLEMVHAATTEMTNARLMLAHSMQQMGEAINTLGLFDDVHRATFEKLAQVSSSTAKLTSLQADNASFLFGDTVKDWMNVTEQAQELLASYDEAQKRYFYAKQQVDKAMNGTASSLESANKKLNVEDQNLKRVKHSMWTELNRFHEDKGNAFDSALFNFVSSEVEHHQKMMSSWQTLLTHINEQRASSSDSSNTGDDDTAGGDDSAKANRTLDGMVDIDM